MKVLEEFYSLLKVYNKNLNETNLHKKKYSLCYAVMPTLSYYVARRLRAVVFYLFCYRQLHFKCANIFATCDIVFIICFKV